MAVVELYGTQKTLPSGSRTPPLKAPPTGYVPFGVDTVFVIGSYILAVVEF